jgi:hypothetical protein
MMESMPDDGSPESKEEEIVRRDACAVGFIGRPSYNSILVILTTVYRGLRYCETNNAVFLCNSLRNSTRRFLQ